MKKTIFAFLVFMFQVAIGFGQFEDPATTSGESPSKPSIEPIEERSSIKDKINIGGGLDIRFGDYTVIGLTPMVSYKVTDKFMAGGIITYRYFKDNITNYSTNTYGVAPFARYQVYRGFFVHAEYEMLKGDWDYKRPSFWIDSFFVGGGYSSQLGEKGFIGIYALWNLTEDPVYPIYINYPVVRIGFGFGL